MPKPDLRPTSEFDPSAPAMVHDQLNDDTFEWVPEKWREHYERYADEHAWDCGLGRAPAGWLAADASALKPIRRSAAGGF
jgi:hypothetical protein